MENKESYNVKNINHLNFFKNRDRILLFYGGAGAGKSFSCCDKIIDRLIYEKNIKGIIVRKTFSSLMLTCIPMMEKRMIAHGINQYYRFNKDELVGRYNNSEIYFLPMHHEEEDYEKITNVDFIWVEEANELTENMFELLESKLKNGQGDYEQIILTFNPTFNSIDTAAWIYDKFFVKNEECSKIHSTVYDNPYMDREYINELEKLKNIDKNLYKIYCLGDWAF